MEDNLLLLPINGWDIDALIKHGEFVILKKLLSYPQELRFTEKGMQLLEEGISSFLFQRFMKGSKRTKNNSNVFDGSSPASEVSFRVESGSQTTTTCSYGRIEEDIEAHDNMLIYNNSGMKGCGIYGVVDGHKGPSVALFVVSHFVDEFLSAAKFIRKQRIKKEEKNTLGKVNNLGLNKELPTTRGTSYLSSDKCPSMVPAVLKRTIGSLSYKMRKAKVADGATFVVTVVTPSKVCGGIGNILIE
jgi:hypothetical protein